MKIIIITGQTAIGKTQLALEYVKKYNGQLINCDSRQIYKYLDIITGKDIIKGSKFKVQTSKNNFDIGYYQVLIDNGQFQIKQINSDNQQLSITNPKEKKPVLTNFNNPQPITTKIWLYDIISPQQYFSSYDYQQCALFVIKEILKKNKTPIIVGGTYFYLYHLLYQVETENIPPDFALRQKLNDKSVSFLQKMLKSLNPQIYDSLNKSDRQNPRRLIRKIEISLNSSYKNLGRSDQSFIYLKNKLGVNNLHIEFIGLKFKNKEKLSKAIKNRVEKRLKNGAIEEVEKLIKMGYSENNPGLKTIGYSQIIKYLKGQLTKKEAIENWIIKEIQYAKRQYTFMKKDKHIKWLNI